MMERIVKMVRFGLAALSMAVLCGCFTNGAARSDTKCGEDVRVAGEVADLSEGAAMGARLNGLLDRMDRPVRNFRRGIEAGAFRFLGSLMSIDADATARISVWADQSQTFEGGTVCARDVVLEGFGENGREPLWRWQADEACLDFAKRDFFLRGNVALRRVANGADEVVFMAETAMALDGGRRIEFTEGAFSSIAFEFVPSGGD